MDKKFAESGVKVKAFVKKNMYYIIMGVCIIAIATMIIVALTVKDSGSKNVDDPTNIVIDNQDNNDNSQVVVTPEPDTNDNTPVVNHDDNKPDTKVVDNKPVVDDTPDPIVFCVPVNGGAVLKDYAMDTLTYWSTLKLYKVHDGIDYSANNNKNVVAVYGGTVSEVGYDVLNGNYVKIDHGDGLITYYGSLSDPIVEVGQKVSQNTQIGSVSTSASAEMNDGEHVHFSVYKNGEVISPYEYFVDGGK